MSQAAPEPIDFDSRWDYGDPAASEATFRALVPAVEAAGDADAIAQLTTQIARAQGLQRRFDDANATLDEVQAMLDDSTPVAYVRYLLERGRVTNSSGDPAVSKPWFERAWAASKDEPSMAYHAVDTAHMLGIVCPDDAMRWNHVAIKAAEQAQDERTKRWLGALYNNTGWTLHAQGHFEEALTFFERALAFHERQGNGNARACEIARWTVARCYRSMARLDEALAVQRDLERLGNANDKPDGYVYEEIGELLLAKGDPDAAAPYFGKAHYILSADPWLAANEQKRLSRMAALAESPP